MPDTIHDEVPPTVRDEAPRSPRGPVEAAPPDDEPLATLPDIEVEPAPVASRSPRRSRRAAILTAAIASLLTIVGLVIAVRAVLFGYEPHARRHVPGNASLVVRVELADLALFAPVREQLGPLLDPADPASKRRLARIREATGVNLATDVRELFVATVDTTSWVVLAGGRITRGRLVSGIARVAREDRWLGDFHKDGELLVGLDGRLVVGQADDGTIVAGTDAALVRAALPASDDLDWPELPRASALPWSGPAGRGVHLLVTKQALGSASDRLPGVGAVLGKIERATGELTLSRSPELSLSLTPTSGEDPAAITRDLDLLLAELRLGRLTRPDVAGEKGALEAARAAMDEGRVKIVAPWPYEGLERGCSRLAELLGEIN